MKKICLLFLLLAACSEQKSLVTEVAGEAVIYGEDTRKEVSSGDRYYALAAATASLVQDYNLKVDASGKFRFPVRTLKNSFPLCKNEPFLDQPLVGFCTGVLIAPNRVLTAGHCLPHEGGCEHIRFHFGWTAEQAAKSNSLDTLYSCTAVIQTENNLRKGFDYAILQLDRDVAGVAPVKVSTDKISTHDAVLSLSYPLGLPLKADLGKVSNESSFGGFKVEVDTFSGSSGSPLFNKNGELIGILSSGAEDILEDDIYRIQKEGGCLNFNRCNDGTCFGETFTKTSLIPDLKQNK
ncbi:trypsin-like serine peptidase [Bdellovibrio svalbardensis]|uniref:Serine protease n=1 Tax=Bdellovibrio svalbardensis TaxID=2972972 RepID=A0ABT6DFF7_9BACT|nr:serine protease [Bdellovibrio svalbardensis]MDG0815015.1 serine protease [Bdellovibrio svalbardensis]